MYLNGIQGWQTTCPNDTWTARQQPGSRDRLLDASQLQQQRPLVSWTPPGLQANGLASRMLDHMGSCISRRNRKLPHLLPGNPSTNNLNNTPTRKRDLHQLGREHSYIAYSPAELRWIVDSVDLINCITKDGRTWANTQLHSSDATQASGIECIQVGPKASRTYFTTAIEGRTAGTKMENAEASTSESTLASFMGQHQGRRLNLPWERKDLKYSIANWLIGKGLEEHTPLPQLGSSTASTGIWEATFRYLGIILHSKDRTEDLMAFNETLGEMEIRESTWLTT